MASRDEKLLAAEQLVIGVLQPVLAHRFVGQVVHVLEDRQPCHQPRRQGRTARATRVGGSKALFEEVTVNLLRQIRQRVHEVDDLIKARSQ